MHCRQISCGSPSSRFISVELNVRLEGALRAKLFATLVAGVRLGEQVHRDLVQRQLRWSREPDATNVALVRPSLHIVRLHVPMQRRTHAIPSLADCAHIWHCCQRSVRQLMVLLQGNFVGESLLAVQTMVTRSQLAHLHRGRDGGRRRRSW